MRTIILLAMLMAFGARAQGVPDAFEITQRYADQNAPQLALARVEQMQPAAMNAPRWADWEQLRCALLSRLSRHQELTKRVVALPPGAPGELGEVEFGGMVVNLATRTLTKNGVAAALTTGEFALLKVLVTHARTPLSRDKLMELARGREYEVFDRSIDVQISRLRKLIEADPAHPTHIQTVWGFGYVFIPDGKPT